MTTHAETQLLKRGQRGLDSLVGAKIIDARAVLGGVCLEVTHRGCDDDSCQMTVPLSAIHFWDEEDSA